jgi:hypothetical protein
MSFWHENIFATHFEEQPVALAPYKWPGEYYLGVALPHRKALGKKVAIIREEFECIATVCDLGPLCLDDGDYVFGNARPRAEIYKGKHCPLNILSQGHASIPDGHGGWIPISISNGAGIDLMPATARALGLKKNENAMVSWMFIET